MQDKYGSQPLTKLILFLFHLEPSIQFVELSGSYSLVLQIDEAAKWVVDIQSFPPGPIFNAWWTDNHGVRIPWSYQEDHEKVATLFDNKTTTLTISYPRIADLGNYTLFVDNGRVQKQQTFQLLIKGMVVKIIKTKR